MTISAAANFGISVEKFENLFSNAVDSLSILQLGQSAGKGNKDSIDILLNLALADSKAGKMAEDILYDLFSGKVACDTSIADEIQAGLVSIYKMASENFGNALSRIFDTAKLLYIVGSGMTGKDDLAQISRLITYSHNSDWTHEKNLWGANRLVESDEIAGNMSNLTIMTRARAHPPNLLMSPCNNENYLKDTIASEAAQNDWLNGRELFSVNTINHWVFIGLDKASDGTVKAVVFNSTGQLPKKTKNQLKIALAGVVKNIGKDLVFVEKNMQKNVPNGCGIFVVEAATIIAENDGEEMSELLKKFADDFSILSDEQQTQFNIQKRRQIFEPCLKPMD